VIEISGLRKSFGQTVALAGLNLTVASGEVHGFLGPNGAGKTTTIRILLGLLRAGGGRPGCSAVIRGRTLASDAELLLLDEPTRRGGARVTARSARGHRGRCGAVRPGAAVGSRRRSCSR
jgi:ABC-type Mn2+/Zn2+ transport system ATPase subunit